MKKFTKLLGIVLIIALVLSMGTMALAENLEPSTGDATQTTTVATSQTFATGNAANADGKYTISVASDDTHTYTVYQILTGSLVAGESKLGNAAWGSDAIGTGTVKDFIDSITVADLTNAEISALVSAQLKDGATGVGTVSASTSLDVVPGYYLIVDSTQNLADGDAYSLNIVAVFNDIQITPKKGTTTSDKKVDDKNDSNTTEDATVWEDTADYDIGDNVPFRLSATIAEDYANYTHGYKLTFHDKMEAGLTFNDDVKVYVDEIKEANLVADTNYSVTKNPTDGDTFDVSFANLKSLTNIQAGSVIYVTFTAQLNANAKFGSEGNPNGSHITYTNNPNDDQAGENGKTPVDTVIVFTYKAIFDKYTTEGTVKKHLAGAEFILFKVKDDISDEAYKALTADDATDATKVIQSYTAVKTDGKYENETAAVAGSVFTINGIDDGTYVLVETTTPAGYNTADNLKFVVAATHNNDDENPATQLVALTGNLQTGVVDATKTTPIENGANAVTAEILNQSGAVLPSTGGIGTTIFYVVGSVLVIAAAVLLITKKRMDRD